MNVELETEIFDIEMLSESAINIEMQPENPTDITVSDGAIIYRELEIPESYPKLIQFWMQNGIN